MTLKGTIPQCEARMVEGLVFSFNLHQPCMYATRAAGGDTTCKGDARPLFLLFCEASSLQPSLVHETKEIQLLPATGVHVHILQQNVHLCGVFLFVFTRAPESCWLIRLLTGTMVCRSCSSHWIHSKVRERVYVLVFVLISSFKLRNTVLATEIRAPAGLGGAFTF